MQDDKDLALFAYNDARNMLARAQNGESESRREHAQEAFQLARKVMRDKGLLKDTPL